MPHGQNHPPLSGTSSLWPHLLTYSFIQSCFLNKFHMPGGFQTPEYSSDPAKSDSHEAYILLFEFVSNKETKFFGERVLLIFFFFSFKENNIFSTSSLQSINWYSVSTCNTKYSHHLKRISW